MIKLPGPNSIPGNGNEHGIALIVALVMIGLLTILAAWAIATSTTELQVARNYRNSQHAFYAAHSALEYGQSNGSIFNEIVPDRSNAGHVWPKSGSGDGLSRDFNTVPGLESNRADVKIEFISSGQLPIGSGTDPELFQGFYYVIRAVGRSPDNTEVDLESQIVRIMPK